MALSKYVRVCAQAAASAPAHKRLLLKLSQFDSVFCAGDPRQRDVPVASLEARDEAAARDCWCVAFGNSYNDQERVVVAGYDNGDVKM